MKIKFLLVGLYFFTACSNKIGSDNSTSNKELTEEENYTAEKYDTIILGDINHDNLIDTAFIFTPPTLLEIDKNVDTLFSMGCKNYDCFNKINFSSKLPSLRIENSVSGQIERIDDIDNDGTNELLFATNWFTTTRSNLYLLTIKNGKWLKADSVSFRNGENNPLKDQYVHKNGKYYLKGIKNIEGDETDFIKEVKL